MSERDYYKVLGIPFHASPEEIKRAYHRLAQQYHPDTNHEGSSQLLFQFVAEAYTVLSDPERRQAYDSRRRKAADYSAEEAKAKAKEEAAAKQKKANSRVGRPSSVFEKLKDGLNPIFGAVKSPEKPSAQTESKSEAHPTSGNLFEKLRGKRQFQFSIDALEALRGTTRDVALNEGGNPKVVRVKVPAGIHDGTVLRIVDKDSDGFEEEIQIKVLVTPHSFVSVEKRDIILHIPVTVGEAIQGAWFEIPTLEGPLRVKIPAGVTRNKKLRLKGKGIVDPVSGDVGDLYVAIYIVPPDNITDSVRQAAQTIDNNYSENVRKDLPKKL